MGEESFPDRPARDMDVFVQGRLLNAYQKMISKKTEEYMGLCSVLKLMKDRSFTRWAFHITGGCLYTCNKDITPPDFIASHILTISFYD